MTLRRLLLLVVVPVVAVVASASPAGAHPLGNFTVNQSSGIVVGADDVRVDYVVDMAEIPTYQAHGAVDTDGDDTISKAEAIRYATRSCTDAAVGLELAVDGARVPLALRTSSATFPEGQAGLVTTRIECGYVADVAIERASSFTFRNTNEDERIGWREITVAGDRTTLTNSTAPTTSVSNRLTRYPKDALSAPPDERSASFTATPGGPALVASDADATPDASQPRGVDAATRAFTDFVGRQDLTLPVALVALLLAMVLGAIHAFAPGHGKTVMAAYLVGRHGSLRQASVIALTVTATHTAGVLLLGLLVSASAIVAPERLYPWLGAISGVLLLGIGVTMLRAGRRRSPVAHEHHDHAHAEHEHDHGHAHHDHDHDHAHHDHDHDHAHHEPEPDPGHRHGGRWHTHAPPTPGTALRPASLLAMGFVGGLLPSPSALVVLLGAIALHRAWFGVVLVTAYGAGMALTLTGAGLLLVRGRDAIERRLQVGRRLPALLALERRLPTITGTVVILVGLFIAAGGVRTIL